VYKEVMFAAVLLTAFALTGKAAGTLERLVKVGDGLKFPEGPAYDGKGNVVVSNCSADYVTQFDAEGHATVLYKAASDSFTFQKTNGMTYYKDGSLFVCDFGRNAIIRIHPDGKQEVYADRCDGQPFKGPNDLAFDPHGNLYFSDPAGSDEKNPIGCVYRVEQGTRKVTRVAEGMAFPNGIAFSADAKTLYVAESNRFRILRFAVQADGSLGPQETYSQFPQDYVPDGMNFDSAGNLWVALYTPGVVGVVDTSGHLARELPMPGKGVTNVEFADRDLKTLYITVTDTGALYKLRVETPGLPLFCAPPNRAKK
jgi:gluconolactonase